MAELELPKRELIVVDPGHFHAALAQKEMYPNLSPRAQVYAPVGPDLVDYLTRISRFNTRTDAPTNWRLEIHAAPDFIELMARDNAGKAAIFAGRNSEKIAGIAKAIEAGIHVLSDKPMIIRRADLSALAAALDAAEAKGLVVQDMMGGRQEVTRALTRLIHADRGVFGEQLPGTTAEPGVEMTSVHHLLKVVSGVTNPRPPWYFDIAQQGDALADIGTHLVDRVHTTLFPGEALDHRRDIGIDAVRRWPTMMNLMQFRQVTGEMDWPGYLGDAVAGGTLAYQCNTHLDYTVRGVRVGLDMVWEWLEPPGGSDTHTEIWRGAKARIELRHGPEEGWRPQLYVVPLSDIAVALERRISALGATYPGLALERRGKEWRIAVPDELRIGHDAHFRETTRAFLAHVEAPDTLPAWEKPNLIAKYFVCTAAEAASH
jgi:predicted dehydrogenase